MDLRKLFEEILPWLVIAGMYYPWLRKKLRKQKQSGAKVVQSVSPAPKPSAPSSPRRKASPSVRPKAAAFTPEPSPRPIVSANLPDEGIPAIEPMVPMKPVQAARRHFSPRRKELRKALLLGEILQPKY